MLCLLLLLPYSTVGLETGLVLRRSSSSRESSSSSRESSSSSRESSSSSRELVSRSSSQQPIGELCVDNDDCVSNCCLYLRTISGKCVERAPLSHVCGFMKESRAGSLSPQLYYRLCSTCESNCCCGDGCCPSSYCVTVLEISPEVCTTCVSGCCCYPNPGTKRGMKGAPDELCCAITFCAASSGLSTIQGTPCLRCQSGCCCGDSSGGGKVRLCPVSIPNPEFEDPECCISSFCKGSSLGRWCSQCLSGCCCGDTCCAYSFCDRSAVSLTRLLSLYSGLTPEILREPSRATMDVFEPGIGGLRTNKYPTPFDPTANYFSYFGAQIGLSTSGWPCTTCTTGCCCNYGCCSNAYCNLDQGYQGNSWRNGRRRRSAPTSSRIE